MATKKKTLAQSQIKGGIVKKSGVTENEEMIGTSFVLPKTLMQSLKLACEMSGDSMAGILRKAIAHYLNIENKTGTFKTDSYIPQIENKVMIPVELYADIRGVEPITLTRWNQQKKIAIHKIENGVGSHIDMVVLDIDDPAGVVAKIHILEGMISVMFDNFKEAFIKEESQEAQIKQLLSRIEKLEKNSARKIDKPICD